MAFTYHQVVAEAERKFVDEGNDALERQDWVNIINMTQILIVRIYPPAYTKVENLRLAPGVFQTVASDVIRLEDILANMGAAGAAVGAPVTETTRELMDRFCEDWATATASATVEQFMRETETDFLVYPPVAAGGTYVRSRLVKSPPMVVYDSDTGDWTAQPLALGDAYAPAYVNGLLFNAYDEDSDIPGNATRADLYFNRMLRVLGLSDAQKQAARTMRKTQKAGDANG